MTQTNYISSIFLSIINNLLLIISFNLLNGRGSQDVNNYFLRAAHFLISKFYFIVLRCRVYLRKAFFVFAGKRFSRVCPSLIVEFCMVDIKQRTLIYI